MPNKSRAPKAAAAATPGPTSAGPAAAPDVSGLDPSGRRGNDFARDQLAARTAGAGGAGLPADKAAAVARQEKGRKTISTLIQSAASMTPDPSDPFSRPNMLRNSAQWVLAGEIGLEVLGPVHDGAARGVAAGQRAYFGAGTPYTAAPPAYGPASTGIESSMIVDAATTEALVPNGGEVVQFLDPASHGEAGLGTKLIHEIQHDADRHTEEKHEGPADASLYTASGAMYALFESEFRAYWLQAGEGRGDEHFGSESAPAESFPVTAVHPRTTRDQTVAASPLQNGRQARILMQMTRESPGVNGEKAEDAKLEEADFAGPYGWVTHYYVFDEKFRGFVNGLARPSSANATNSVRIEALYDALETGDQSAITAALGKLEPGDHTLLRDKATSSPAWTRLIAGNAVVAAVKEEGYEAAPKA